MSFFYHQQSYFSEKNGEIVVRKTFGRLKVLVSGYDQSSRYIADMWADALAHLPAGVNPKRVLLLGLGVGSVIPKILERFPEAHIKVIEWDPVMIELAKSFGTCPNDVAVGDAVEIVPALTDLYDLIIVDLFRGGVPEPRLSSDEMVSHLLHRMDPKGYVLLNPFKKQTLIALFQRQFATVAVWSFKMNALALFRRAE